MVMQRVFDGEVRVDYSQIYVQTASGWSTNDLRAGFAGQVNGLCGAGISGGMWLVTGLHMGNVGFVVELHDQQPVIDDAWEEIVEVSFRADSFPSLVQW